MLAAVCVSWDGKAALRVCSLVWPNRTLMRDKLRQQGHHVHESACQRGRYYNTPVNVSGGVHLSAFLQAGMRHKDGKGHGTRR